MPKRGPRNLPAVQRIGKPAPPYFNRKLVNVLGSEIVTDVIIAWAVISSQFARKRRKHRACSELEKSSVRDFVHALTEGVVDLTLQTVPELLRGRELKTVVMAAGAGGKLRHRTKP